MATTRAQAEQSRRALIDAAAAEFRHSGYAGAGVDAIARRAGLTSGAFYRHFGSKAEVFAIVVTEGMAYLAHGIRHTKGIAAAGWQRAFTDFYFGPYYQEIEAGCALPGLAAEIVRADEDAKEAFSVGVEALARELASDLDSLPADVARSRVLAALATMAGGVMLARAAASQELADDIAAAAAHSVLQLLTDREFVPAETRPPGAPEGPLMGPAGSPVAT